MKQLGSQFWLRAAMFFQFPTALFHSLSFLSSPVARNETEQQLLDLMTNHKLDLGNGFHRTMSNVFDSMSVSFVLLLVLGGCINWIILKQKAPIKLIKSLTLLQVTIYGICFLTMLMWTFLPPILCSLFIFICLLISYFKLNIEMKE